MISSKVVAAFEHMFHSKTTAALFNNTISSEQITVTSLVDEIKPQEKHEKLICLFDESPYYILKVAAQGNLEEVIRLFKEDPDRLRINDYRGQNIIHHSVTWSRLNVLDYVAGLFTESELRAEDSLINEPDKVLNTPLHHAIEKGQKEAIKWLLHHGASLTVTNIHHQAPIHTAIDLDRVDVVQLILEKHSWMVNYAGDMGATPLHYACARNSAAITRILLEKGADLVQNNSCPAITAATKYGASNAIEVLMEYAVKKGLSCKHLIHMVDKDKNNPLQNAVNSCDPAAVNACLRAGSDIDVQHPDTRQTAIHNAAAQGAAELIALMFEAQPDKKETCLHCRDILEQTPLHKAAMFNHVTVVEHLIDEGASVNAQDGEKMTPLLLAAAKDATAVVNLLLKKRANTTIRDKDNRNFLHLAVIQGTKIKDIDLSVVKNLTVLLNERDDFGCTPIHYASKSGQLATLHGLMEFGANLMLKDNARKNPLHLAAKYGRVQTCQKLLSDESGIMLINEFDADGRTPLAIAAINGQVKVLTMLFQRGAMITNDFEKNSALHLAAMNGHYEAVAVVIGLAPHLLNTFNKKQSTALHLAAVGGHANVVDYLMTTGANFYKNADGATFFDLAISKYQTDVCGVILKHFRCEEALQLPSIFITPFIGLIQNMPDMAILLMDRCIQFGPGDRKSSDFYIASDFRYLQTPCYLVDNRGGPLPIQPMNAMVKCNRPSCLAHPLCISFLNQKWESFGSLLYNIRFSMFAIFLVLLASIVNDFNRSASIDDAPQYENEALSNNYTANFNDTFVESTSIESANNGYLKLTINSVGWPLLLRVNLLLIFCFLNMMTLSTAIFYQKMQYLFYATYWMEWLIYVAACASILPVYFDTNLTAQTRLWCAAVALFFGCINIFVLLRYRSFGMYIVMFGHGLVSLIRVLAVFSLLLFGFALVFKIAFRTTDGHAKVFQNPWISFMTSLSMLIGETNYVELIIPTLDGRQTLLLGILTYIVFASFLILVPTILKNLLIGLTVGDIENVRKNARLERLALTVELFTLLEERLPRGFLRKRWPTQGRYYPNSSRKNIIATIIDSFWRDEGSAPLLDSLTFQEATDIHSQHKADLGVIIKEVTRRAKVLTGLFSQVDAQQDMVKTIIQRMDNHRRQKESGDSAFICDVDDEDEVHNDDDENADNVSLNSGNSFAVRSRVGDRRSSHEYHSSGAVLAHLTAIASQASQQKKGKTKNVWHAISKPSNKIGATSVNVNKPIAKSTIRSSLSFPSSNLNFSLSDIKQ